MEKKNLVIVESPAKAKTIGKYLGKNFKVLASYGHVRDLLPKKGSVDPENNFNLTYSAIEKNKKYFDKIVSVIDKVDSILLATDPDREGEAISWHITELLKEKELLNGKDIHRVVFHEITKNAIRAAIDNPRDISMDLVNAQQARRALDYLVGFNLSPLLWKKIRQGLSAGRVQSPALRMIVEREAEIKAFKSQEYWTIESALTHKSKNFVAKLNIYENTKLKQFSINNEKQALKTRDSLLAQANGELIVTKITKKQRKRNPTAPFITSTLQQEASRKLGFGAQRTMRIAQQLYEGIDIGNGAEGLITYMRTDSVHLAKEAIEEIRDYISKQYGVDHLPKDIQEYKTKSKNAQEAHEGIRPTNVNNIPENIKDSLSKDQFRLYELIWKRAVACQMIHATINTVSVDLSCGEQNNFHATGSTIAKPGFMAVYLEGSDDEKAIDDKKEKILPELNEGDKVKLKEIKADQHFTEPPPRFTEASLVKSLEEHDIGRPSTYASIISTLQNRGYAILEKKRFTPTDIGEIVVKFLTEYFNKYVDYDFTAGLEDQLDAISRGEKKWTPLLKDFWKPFIELIQKIEENVDRSSVTTEKLDEKCPKCTKQLSIRLGRHGRFIGCDGYPECDYTRNLDDSDDAANEPEVLDKKCPKCSADLVIKIGRYGKFIGCSGYPNCKHMEPIEKPKETEVECPECKKGKILQRKSRYGKIFYSCANYPKCKYAVWYEPVSEQCPDCSWPILTIKVTKRKGTEKVCPQKECNYSEQIELPE
ncbi:MAG: type I DNA topoisomerase [Legionellales bacterium]|nr:type I DNA topoisomerase [Legionellales bacterium]